MDKYEKELFFALCNHTEVDNIKLTKLLPDYATPELLGHLFFNRVHGIAYGILKNNGLLNLLNREFRNSLRYAHMQNSERNRSYYECLRILSEVLSEQYGKFAMLKGALLCKRYPEGYRTSNDVDLLVSPEFVSDIGETLSRAGFRQGNIRDGVFVPATRKEIIESKMMRGETVPYFYKIDLPYMEYIEVDINFSLDYKNGKSEIVEEMISRSQEVELDNISIMTLDKYDFLIHLCCHLYKEATTLPWVRMKRDMTIYKYCDIRLLTDSMTNEECNSFLSRAIELGTAEVCACALLWTDCLLGFQNSYVTKSACNILKDNPELLHTVISPAENKRFIYTEKDIKERFFASDRTSLLKEVT